MGLKAWMQKATYQHLSNIKAYGLFGIQRLQRFCRIKRIIAFAVRCKEWAIKP